MHKCFILYFLISAVACKAQQTENIIIITTDGLRWQEVFKGMDATLANDNRYNEGDSSYIFATYWGKNEQENRKKLMPFFWTVMEKNGQIYGNRNFVNNVNNANQFWFSYPGYSEMLTGYADPLINANSYPPNPHVTVLEYLNQQPKLNGKVAAFAAWEAFDRIINEERSGIPVASAFDLFGGKNPTAKQKLINNMLTNSYKPWLKDECLDVFTHYGAMEELKTNKPKVLYIAYGETDEWAHGRKYRSYLDAANQVDAWIKQIWDYVQSDPQYRNKTSLFISTDHGRGDKTKSEWTSHGSDVGGADEIWFAVMGPGIKAKGEIKTSMQLYQKQFAQTFANLMGYRYKAVHPIAEEIKLR